MRCSYGNCMTELVTEMPRSFSSAIQSDVAWRAALRDFTLPALWIAPPNSSSFSVSVVLPASGCEMIANVRRRWVSVVWSMDRSGGDGGRRKRPAIIEANAPSLAADDGAFLRDERAAADGGKLERHRNQLHVRVDLHAEVQVRSIR